MFETDGCQNRTLPICYQYVIIIVYVNETHHWPLGDPPLWWTPSMISALNMPGKYHLITTNKLGLGQMSPVRQGPVGLCLLTGKLHYRARNVHQGCSPG